MRFSPPLQVLERGPGGEVSESPTIVSVSWSPDSTRVTASGRDGSAAVWDASTGERIIQYAGSGYGVNSFGETDWNPLDNRIALHRLGEIVVIWDAETGDNIGQSFDDGTSIVTDVVWSPSGNQLALGTLANRIDIFNLGDENPNDGQLAIRFETGPHI